MATRYWQPTALATYEKKTITVANTWATSDTGTITINGNDLTVTVGAATTTADVAAALVAAFNGSAAVGTETRNTTGNLIPEFNEITATLSGSTVILTHDTAGVPFTATVSENTAGTGTLAIADTITAQGPNYWNSADNWSGATVPVDGDTVVISSGSVDILYGLNQTSVSLATLRIEQGYTGKIGLPHRNANGYNEYRTTYLTLGDVGDAQAMTVYVGSGEGAGSGRIKIDNGDAQTTLVVYNTGNPVETGVPSLLFKGTHASNAATVNKGSVGFAVLGDETAASTAVLTTLSVGYTTNPAGDSTVRCGLGCALTTVDQSGGKLEINSAATTITKTGGDLTLAGNGVTVTTLNERGGTTYVTGTTTITTANLSNAGVLDYSRDMRSKTIANAVNIYGNQAKFIDPYKVTGSVVLDLEQGGALANHNLGQHVKLTRGTPT